MTLIKIFIDRDRDILTIAVSKEILDFFQKILETSPYLGMEFMDDVLDSYWGWHRDPKTLNHEDFDSSLYRFQDREHIGELDGIIKSCETLQTLYYTLTGQTT